MNTRNIVWVAAGLLALAQAPVSGEETKDSKLAKPVNQLADVAVSIYQLDRQLSENFDAWLTDVAKVDPKEKDPSVVERAIRELLIPEGKAEIIAQPRLAAPIGQWSSLGMRREIKYATDYAPASVPGSLAKKARTASDENAEALPVNQGDVLLPPFPNKFENRDLGLGMKVMPSFGKNAALSVTMELERSALRGFVDFGSPIVMDKPNALRKNAKPLELLENHLWMPSFLAEKETFTASTNGPCFRIVPGEASKETSERMVDANFGQEFSEAELAPLLVVVSAKKLDTSLKTFTTGSPTAPTENRTWQLSTAVRSALDLNEKGPGVAAANSIKEKFASLGIGLSETRVTPTWSFEATASPPDLKRIDELLTIYEHNPRVYIASKFIETSEPLSDLLRPFETGAEAGNPKDQIFAGGVLEDVEFQKLIRAMNQQTGVDLLSAPSVMLRPFQQGNVEVVREFIYPVAYDPPKIDEARQKKEGAFPATPSTPKEFKTENTGVRLAVLPRVFEDGSIELELEPRVLEFLGFLDFGQPIYTLEKGGLGKTQRVVISENQIYMPIFDRREFKTRLRIPDGGTVFIGGLVKTDVQTVEDKVPVLGDLPVVGRVARSTEELTVRRYLYVAVTASVVEGAGGKVIKKKD